MIEYCSLASGSCGNSHYIKLGQLNILVDVGMSARYITGAMEQIGETMHQVDAVFVTHDHSDHIKGLAVLAKKYPFAIYIAREIYARLQAQLEHIPLERFVFIEDGKLELGDIKIEIFSVAHDATRTFGYTFEREGKKIGIATDIGHISDKVREALGDCDFLVIESNHDEHLVEAGRYPYLLKQRILGEKGHLSNKSAAEFIADIYHQHQRLKFIVLAHLSQENNYPELAYISVEQVLAAREIEVGRDLMMSVALRQQISERFRII